MDNENDSPPTPERVTRLCFFDHGSVRGIGIYNARRLSRAAELQSASAALSRAAVGVGDEIQYV